MESKGGTQIRVRECAGWESKVGEREGESGAEGGRRYGEHTRGGGGHGAGSAI